MLVWLVEIGEPLPFQSDQRLLRYGEFSRVLAERGHRVVWWACNFSHQSRRFIGEPNARTTVDGVEIVLVQGSGYGRNVGLRRLRHLAVHARNFSDLIVRERPPDLILSAMPTVESGLVALKFAQQRAVKLVVDIRDEWPEDFVRWTPRLLRPLARAGLRHQFAKLTELCRGADAITAVTARQLRYGLQYAGRPKGSDDAVFHTGARARRLDDTVLASEMEKLREQHGLAKTDFICSFSGTLSPSRPLVPVIQAVKRLSEEFPIKLLVVGTGDMEAAYRKEAGGHPAIRFAGWLDAVRLSAVLNLSDALMAPYDPSFGFSLPTKIFDYLAAGRPLVSSCPGEAADLLEQHQFGVQVPHDDPGAIRAALRSLHADPSRRQSMGETARRVFEADFEIGSILQRYAAHLEALAGRQL